MKKRFICLLVFFLAWPLIFFPELAWPQLVLGQYEDEAPFRTWNTFGFSTAASLAMGETQFARATNCSASLSNPALLTRLAGMDVTLNSSLAQASFFKYSLVNTGVLQSDGNLSLGLIALDFAGVSVKVKDWAFALSAGLTESYYRPAIDERYYWRNQLFYTLTLNQEGNLKTINLSVARQLWKRFSFGLGFNYAFGSLKIDYEETWTQANISIADREFHRFHGVFLNGGLVWEFTPDLTVAFVFRLPYVKKAESEASIEYDSPGGDTHIRIKDAGESDYRQPLVLAAGMSYIFSPRLRVDADLTFYDWSAYSVTYFKGADLSEDAQEAIYKLERDFKDILKYGFGLEYLSSIKLFGPGVRVPLRLGMSYDPQPMRVPDSAYFYISFGLGVHWRKLHLDAGMLIGQEKGSGRSLSGQKLTLSLSYQMEDKPWLP